MNIILTIHDEDSNMASIVAIREDGKILTQLFDIEEERFVDGMLTIYPASMMEQAMRKALTVASPVPHEGLRQQVSETKAWIAQMDKELGFI